MTLRALFLVAMATLAACYRHDPLYCDVTADCADVPGRPFCDATGEHPASEGIARTCIPDPGGGGGPGPDAGLPAIGVTATALPHLQIGGSLAVDVRIARPTGSDGAIELTVPSLPPGIAVAALAIPSSMSTGVLTVTAATDAPFGPVALQLAATDGTHGGYAEIALEVVGVPGTRDTSFGTAGEVLVQVSQTARLVQSVTHDDGIIAVLDDASLVRLTADGIVDDAFGEHGHVSLDVSSLGISSIAGIRIALGTAGSVVMVGYGPATATSDRYLEFLARVTSDGTVALRPMLLHADPREDRTCGVTVAHNGKVIVSSRRSTGQRLQRYDTDGTHDRTFEGNLDSSSWCEVLFASPAGGVFTRGGSNEVHGLDVSGAFDRQFGNGGTATLPDALAWSTLQVLPSGSLRIGGTIGSLGVWQMDRTGNPDLGFGDGGYHAYPNVPNYFPTIFAVGEAPGGGLVAAGKITGNHSQGHGAVLVRLHANGRPDDSFATMGVMNENDRWTIANGFLVEGRRAVFLGERRVGELRLKRFWY